MQHNLDNELSVAIGLARQAAKAVMAVYRTDFAVHYKNGDPGNPVTEADYAANRIIVDGLTQAFAHDGILAEESPDNARRLQCQRLWCIDPVDGTREFVSRNGQFIVMIGLAIDRRAVLGVLYQPTEDKLFYGVDGAAFVEDAQGRRPLRVSDKRRTQDAIVAVSRAHRSATVSRMNQALGTDAVLPIGSVGLKVTSLCESRADLYATISAQTHEWDACGPAAVLAAAGGTMTDVFGNPLQFNKPQTNTPYGMLASNGHLHQACLAALHKSMPRT